MQNEGSHTYVKGKKQQGLNGRVQSMTMRVVGTRDNTAELELVLSGSSRQFTSQIKVYTFCSYNKPLISSLIIFLIVLQYLIGVDSEVLLLQSTQTLRTDSF